MAVLLAAVGAYAQCEAPSNFEAHPFWNRVSLSWETSNMGFLDTLTYGESYSTRIGTNDADTFTVAIRFTPSELSSANGQYLSHVAFIPGETTVHEFTIKIWVGGSHPDASTFNEGTLVSSEVVLPSQVTTASWNVIPLSTPVLIDATQELWIGYECTATGGYPAGAGADNVINGTNDLIGFGGNWTTLASSNLTYGWCIMGYTKDLSISGFNILRNNVQLNTSLITDNNYIDTDVLPETQRFPVAELHLGDMPRFMDRQLQRPRRRVGVIRLLYRVQVHPARRPAHGAVGIGITGMEQDGERPPLVLARHHSQARPDHRPVLFQQAEIGPRERIRPLGVDQPVSL